MNRYTDKKKDTFRTNAAPQHLQANARGRHLQDNRSQSVVQLKLAKAIEAGAPVQRKPNNTSLPGQFKSGIESLSGHSMDDVIVHYNSAKPAQLNARAYAQGSDIHIASGQEKHLPHEAWHVVQQKQGRVSTTVQMKSKVNINDNKELEKEADVMGQKVLTAPNACQKVSAVNGTEKSGRPVSQLLKDDEYQKLNDDIFNKHKTKSWPDFYKKQAAFQGEMKTSEEKDKYEFTTFGTEYEMVPYPSKSPIANTAHIKLAIGQPMPVEPGVKEVLVTDSDNIIEYVTPVLVMPLEKGKSTLKDASARIVFVRDLLSNYRKQLPLKTSFGKLIENMNFTTWAVQPSLNISFREIDEKTNIGELTKARNWGKTDIEEMQLGSDEQKNPKHTELKKEDPPGSALQTTILIPLDIVAKIVRNYFDPPKKEDKVKTKAPKSAPIKPPAKSIGLVLTEHLIKYAGENSDLINLLYLFGQRLGLVLESPNAVKFQAHHQRERVRNTPFEDTQDATMDAKLLEQYAKEEREYAQYAGKQSEIPQNFHNAHSGIKDRLSIWTRIHMDDLIGQIFSVDKAGKLKGVFLNETDKFIHQAIKESETADRISKKISFIVKQKIFDTQEEKASAVTTSHMITRNKHASVSFLSENDEYPDLRQDTLRDIKYIKGRPWVLIEIRDLKDETLDKLMGLAKDDKQQDIKII